MAFDPGLASMQEHSSREQLQSYCLSQKYLDQEVFLSHSGKQKPFVYDLFDDFRRVPRFQANEPFFDVQDASLPKGEEWIDRLTKAARNCKLAVLILTKDFLTSKWPMLELLHFIKAQKTTNRGMKLLPVFYDPYDLLPADLSDNLIQKQWKVEWEKIIGSRSSKPSEVALTIEACEEALQSLRRINGIVAQKGKPFAELRRCIVEKVLVYLPPGYDPEVDPDVEGCRRLCDMISQMFQKNDEGIECLGMYGIGGSGKTTMCAALCSYFGRLYNHRVYHLQIGENDSAKSQENSSDRCKKLLMKLMLLSAQETDRIQEPRKVLKMEFGKGPVFLAVDDVREDLSSHLEVQGYLSYLCPGSRIIITARSRDIVEKVTKCADYCRPIPNLEEKEALTLFLKIAAPKSNLNALTQPETDVLLSCLRICFFKIKEEANHNSVHKEAGGDSVVPTKGGQYHPLALRAVASYFQVQYSKLGSDIVQCGQELLTKHTQLFNSDASQSIFDVLGFGYDGIHEVSKQLFIDVALYAPRSFNNNIFNWLVDVNGSDPDYIRTKLDRLRKMSFLDYEDDLSGPYPCIKFSMHELYREYAKILVNKHENKYSYKYGIYYDHHYQAPPVPTSSGWAKASRIRLAMWKEVIKMKEWRRVSVIHLFHCETITTFSIGCELVNLRELKIHESSRLEEVSWTQEINTEQLRGEMKLCYVELSHNRRLKNLPDFSNCSNLRELAIIECSSSVEPLHLHTCSSLELLQIVGKINAPEVRSLRSCLKLRSVELAWRASYKGQLDLDNLPSLSKLVITGPSDQLYENIVLHGHKLFCQYYPEETVCYEVTGIWKLTNLKSLHLNYVPLGCLPGRVRTIGSSLGKLNLRGCLLSQLVDFSEFPNLQHLTIAQTNVKELRGLGGLKKLVYLDCRFNFRLQKIPNLRPCGRLKHVLLDQCPELQEIPRLPPSYCTHPGGSVEECERLAIAFEAFTNTAKSAMRLPLGPHFPRFEPSTALGTSTDQVEAKLSHLSLSRGVPNPTPHVGIECDGCMMKPLIGHRYKAKDIETKYNLCRKCYTNSCHRSDCNFKSAGEMHVQEFSWTQTSLIKGFFRRMDGKIYLSDERCSATVVRQADYDLCQACFTEFGCDERDFYPAIHQTIT